MNLTLSSTAALRYSPAEWHTFRADIERIAVVFPAVEITPTYAVFPRAAAAALRAAFPAAALEDNRLDRRHDYAALTVEFYPANYDLQAACAAGGGFFFFSPVSFPRTVANLVRNLAFASGQHVTIFCAAPEDAARRARAAHPDYERYSRYETGPQCQFVNGASSAPFFQGGLALAMLDTGDKLVCQQSLAALSDLPATARFVVATPSHAAVETSSVFAPHFGPTVVNTSAAAPATIFPVHLPFNNPARASESRACRLLLHETIFNMAEDHRRNDACADLIQRTHRNRSLVLVNFISQAGPLMSALAQHNPHVLLPRQHASDAARSALLAEITKNDCHECSASHSSFIIHHSSLILFCTFADAAELADRLPQFDTCYHLTPAAAKLRLPASRPALRRERTDHAFDIRRIFLAVDHAIPELAAAADSFLTDLAARPAFSIMLPDRRYCE